MAGVAVASRVGLAAGVTTATRDDEGRGVGRCDAVAFGVGEAVGDAVGDDVGEGAGDVIRVGRGETRAGLDAVAVGSAATGVAAGTELLFDPPKK